MRTPDFENAILDLFEKNRQDNRAAETIIN
jgi:hypothetical protein